MKGCLIWVGARSLEVVEGDIVAESSHAIVNSAPEALVGGKGIDRVIKAAAGMRLLEDCRKIGHCPIGGAVITPGYSLKAKFVIHAVVPKYDATDREAPAILRKTYKTALAIGAKNNLVSISFPALGTGALGWPVPVAAPIAFEEIIESLFAKNSIRQTRVVILTQADLKTHIESLKQVALARSLRVIDL